MPGETQRDLFRASEPEKAELESKALRLMQEASDRISGPISGGHFEAMLESTLKNDAQLVISDQVRLEIHQAVESANGFWKKVDLQTLASRIATSISQGQ